VNAKRFTAVHSLTAIDSADKNRCDNFILNLTISSALAAAGYIIAPGAIAGRAFPLKIVRYDAEYQIAQTLYSAGYEVQVSAQGRRIVRRQDTAHAA
jgi:hypothetical protein